MQPGRMPLTTPDHSGQASPRPQNYVLSEAERLFQTILSRFVPVLHTVVAR